MSLFRSFRLRIALLTAVVAGIVFGIFSIAAYSLIHNELEKNVETRIMVEARQAFGRGLGVATWRERVTRSRERDDSNARSGRSGGSQPERTPSFADEVPKPGRLPPGLEEATEDADENVQVFANCVTALKQDDREELYRSPNWPGSLPVIGSEYGVGKPIEITEVNDLLRGRRSRRPPPVDGPSGPRREPRRGTLSEPGKRPANPAAKNERATDPGSKASEPVVGGEERRATERRSRGRRWRSGFFLVQQPHFHYRTVDGEHWRIGVFTGERHEVVVAASLTQFTAHVHKLRSAFAIAVPAAVILIALGAWVVSGRAIRPIRLIADTAESVTASGLSRRIDEPGTGDELQRLAVVLNSMLDRLEDGFKQATRFSADASHELKTPLTIMQGELESALRDASPDSPEQSVFVSQLEEVTRLKRIVGSLLLLSRADAGQLNLTRERIDVSSNFAEVCEDAEILADGAAISLEAHVTPNLTIMGDRALLQQVFQNLISNAVKYNQPDGSIICRLSKDASETNAIVEIENTGPGIPEEDQDKVFRRFHRADAARGREVDGFGLGLNLALEIARAHNGDLELVRSDEKSTVFRLTIPLA